MLNNLFLLDTGSGDAIWVKAQPDTKIPKKSFQDILGYGLVDIIKGHRAKAEQFILGSTLLKTPRIAFPDSLSYKGLKEVSQGGVIGAEIMRRFHWYFDYANNRVYLKKNKNINQTFNYDMSGLVLKYDGFHIVRYYSHTYNTIEQPIATLEFKPRLVVRAIRPNSSAYHAGFIEGDEIIKINRKFSYKYNLEEITNLFCSKIGEKINIKIKRKDKIYQKELILSSRFLEEQL